MPESSASPMPDLERNLKLFVLFRVLFNARFYYPIFAVLFFDFGLSPVDFYLLNGIVWTAASILLEVPSGALADRFGRKALVVAAAVLMVLEMVVLSLAPLGGGPLVFVLFFLNRALSGCAEAAASGADEALAYDSIPEKQREETWPKLQGRLMAFQGIGMIVALNVGALCYGLNEVGVFLAEHTPLFDAPPWDFPKEVTAKLPILLCLGTAMATLITTLLMREPPRDHGGKEPTIRDAFATTMEAGRWILHHPAPLYIVLSLVLYDSIVRLFYTVSSSYHRILDIEPAFFGLIGTVGNLTGLVAAPLIAWAVANRSPHFNYRLAALLILGGLLLLSQQIPIWGALVIIPLGLGMRHIHASSSHYLNRVTDSSHRATVLSFRGIAMMLSYGVINLLAIAQVKAVRPPASQEDWDPRMSDEIIRVTSPNWWMWFVVALLFLSLFRMLRYGKSINAIVLDRPAGAHKPDSEAPEA